MEKRTQLAHSSNYGGTRKAIKYLVYHYTANDGDSDQNNAKYFAQANRNASAHWFVDDDSATLSVPEDQVAWSVGGNKYSNTATTGGGKYYGVCTNANSISIELCDTNKNGKYEVTAKTRANAIELGAEIMKRHNIPITNVIRHFDVTGKNCPAYFVSNVADWNKFKNELAAAAGQAQTTTSSTTSTSSSSTNKIPAAPFTVKVIVNDLNIRSAASMSGTVKGVTGKGTFTIVEVKDGWGLLKAHSSKRNGWIYLENPAYVTIAGTSSTTSTSSASSSSTASTPAKKSNEEIAKEVLAGKWGNGAERKKALEAAGYDYAAIQAIVNGTTNKSYKVKVTASALNVRAGAGTGYKVLRVIKQNTQHTIVEEKSGWGKLSTGGWISLGYTKKI